MSGAARPGRVVARLRSINRRVARRWRLTRASVVDTRMTRERLAHALGVDPSSLDRRAGELRASLARRLPAGPGDAAAIGRALAAHAPQELAALATAADRSAARTVDLLGSGPVQLGRPIDWHADFKSGHRWPSDLHHVRIAIDGVAGGDVKVPWELSRGHHLPWLAQAAVLLRREDCAREAVAQIREWIAANRCEYGVNWVCAMDVAIRAVNWIWTAALLAEEGAVDDAFFAELLTSLADHGAFIAANLEDPPDGIRTNHYLADLLGLLYVGACVPELPRAATWRAFARDGLTREIESQVLPDGASYESSIPYHRLVAEIFLSAAALEQHQGRPFGPPYLSRLAAMLEFTAAYTKPNGCAPQLGDADDGRVHVLSGYDASPQDHRHLLAAGAVLFDRDDWWRLSGARWTEALWLGGGRDARRLQPPAAGGPPLASRSFPDAGVHILRNGTDVVVLTAGRVGTAGLGNHKHNDLLAIEVHLGGEDVLVDPGTYLYTADPEARDAFRSTLAHNTVTIDGVEQNEIRKGALFALCSNAMPTRTAWEPAPGGGRVVAEHDGYCRLPSPVTHRRAVTLDADSRVTIEDCFDAPHSGAAHEFVWTFAFAPAVVVSSDVAGWRIALPSGAIVTLTWPADGSGARLPVESRVTTGFVSPRYGVKLRAPVVQWRWCGRPPVAVRCSIGPQAG